MAYGTKITMPGKARGRRAEDDDVRYHVEIQTEEFVWPLRFSFVWTNDEEWAHVGFDVGTRQVKAGSSVAIPSPSEIYWLLDNFFHFRAVAEEQLNAKRNVPKKRKRGKVTPEFLLQIASEYAELEQVRGVRGATAAMARLHNVDRTQIWRWRKRAAAAIAT
jgi:hypothetical protein